MYLVHQDILALFFFEKAMIINLRGDIFNKIVPQPMQLEPRLLCGKNFLQSSRNRENPWPPKFGDLKVDCRCRCKLKIRSESMRSLYHPLTLPLGFQPIKLQVVCSTANLNKNPLK